jgi:hypothetical protein
MTAGRPLKFKTVEELETKIQDYFSVTPKDEWTWTGLAIHLDTSRQTLVNYKERPEFFDSIKKGLDIVANGYEIDLKKHGRTGTIFALKNFDWKDKTESDITSNGEALNPVLVKFIDGK